MGISLKNTWTGWLKMRRSNRHGQIHWKGCVYPVREIDAGNHIFRVSVESLRNELANDMRNGIYEAMEASEEIDGYCTDEELCTLSDTDLYKMYC